MVTALNGHAMLVGMMGASESKESVAARRKREIANGYLTMDAGFGDTSLRVPLGWAFASTFSVGGVVNAGDSDRMILAAQKVLITSRSDEMSPVQLKSASGFEAFKKTRIVQAQARLKAQGFAVGPLELLDLPGEAFAVRALQLTKAGASYSWIEVHQSRSTPAERVAYRMELGKPKTFVDVTPPQQPLALSLLAPAKVYPKYLGLLGLMLRDAGINATRVEVMTLEQFKARTGTAAEFVQLAERTVTQLKAGEVEDYAAQVAPAMAELGQQMFGSEDDKPLTPAEIIQARRRLAADTLQKTVPALQRADKIPSVMEILLVSNCDPIDPIYNVIWNVNAIKDGTPLYQIRMNLVQGKPALQWVDARN